MPLRLSELLERIRPSGTPGAPSEGQQQRIDADRAEELAELAEVLRQYEEEADALVAAANERASGRVQAAEREARQIRSGLADQVAVVQAERTVSWPMPPTDGFPDRGGAGPTATSRGSDPADALDLLLAGNKRFIDGDNTTCTDAAIRRAETVEHQSPIAAILTCSDARVPPQLLFDQPLGHLFTVRIAGNTAADPVVASLIYAIRHLQTRLVVVLGHQGCGAVTATIEHLQAGTDLPGELTPVLGPLVEPCRLGLDRPGDPITNAVEANIDAVTSKLRSLEPLSGSIEGQPVGVVGACYELTTGRVSLLGPAPPGPETVATG